MDFYFPSLAYKRGKFFGAAGVIQVTSTLRNLHIALFHPPHFTEISYTRREIEKDGLMVRWLIRRFRKDTSTLEQGANTERADYLHSTMYLMYLYIGTTLSTLYGVR